MAEAAARWIGADRARDKVANLNRYSDVLQSILGEFLAAERFVIAIAIHSTRRLGDPVTGSWVSPLPAGQKERRLRR